MLRFWVLLIYLTEIKLCINLGLYFVSEALFTDAGEPAVSVCLYYHSGSSQLCSQMLETLNEMRKQHFLIGLLSTWANLSSQQHDFPLHYCSIRSPVFTHMTPQSFVRCLLWSLLDIYAILLPPHHCCDVNIHLVRLIGLVRTLLLFI